jgi:hypothetical protein
MPNDREIVLLRFVSPDPLTRSTARTPLATSRVPSMGCVAHILSRFVAADHSCTPILLGFMGISPAIEPGGPDGKRKALLPNTLRVPFLLGSPGR